MLSLLCVFPCYLIFVFLKNICLQSRCIFKQVALNDAINDNFNYIFIILSSKYVIFFLQSPWRFTHSTKIVDHLKNTKINQQFFFHDHGIAELCRASTRTLHTQCQQILGHYASFSNSIYEIS